MICQRDPFHENSFDPLEFYVKSEAALIRAKKIILNRKVSYTLGIAHGCAADEVYELS